MVRSEYIQALTQYEFNLRQDFTEEVTTELRVKDEKKLTHR